jgi:AcrR family transcriptional regulator
MRENQKQRTRKDLLQAASRLMKQGRKPSLEEVAAEATVSRATAYRHFPSIDALLLEASLDVATPDADTLFPQRSSNDPLARLLRVDAALHDMILSNEAPLRMMLAHSLERVAKGESEDEVPRRQNRRTPLIEAALGPARDEFRPATLDTLIQALALVIGTEAMVVCKDVLQLDDARTRKVKRWAIRALVDAARRTEEGTPSRSSGRPPADPLSPAASGRVRKRGTTAARR